MTCLVFGHRLKIIMVDVAWCYVVNELCMHMAVDIHVICTSEKHVQMYMHLQCIFVPTRLVYHIYIHVHVSVCIMK